jgi:hypothetical protein
VIIASNTRTVYKFTFDDLVCFLYQRLVLLLRFASAFGGLLYVFIAIQPFDIPYLADMEYLLQKIAAKIGK